MTRVTRFGTVVSAILALAACNGQDGQSNDDPTMEQNATPKVSPATTLPTADALAYIRQTCPGVYGVAAKEMVTRLDLRSARDFAGKAALAADADLKVLKGVAGKAELSGQSQLGSQVKAVIQTKSAVTTEFFEQDQTFQSVACFIGGILSDPTLSPEDRAFFRDKRQKITSNRVEYLDVISGLKKN